jgi:hypothetical protein
MEDTAANCAGALNACVSDLLEVSSCVNQARSHIFRDVLCAYHVLNQVKTR